MSWRPSATLETLKARAELFGSVRAFFSARGVMEVDTPILSRHATVDRHIDSFAAAAAGGSSRTAAKLWLHTSPEFAMKRLLAAGCGPIYQLCHVFRVDESGRHHNPEFAMLEWYRPGWDHHHLMDEVAALLAALGGPAKCERLTYREAFHGAAGFDPFIEDPAAARRALEAADVDVPAGTIEWDAWLDLAMSRLVAPRLGRESPCFIHDFPASQAALARVRRDEKPATAMDGGSAARGRMPEPPTATDGGSAARGRMPEPPTTTDGGSAAIGRMPEPPVAERFELFWRGLELANGFHELLEPVEQRARFESDQHWRRLHGKDVPPYDANLIEALESGMPACAGVALGIDRLLMLLLDLPDVASAMAFGADRA